MGKENTGCFAWFVSFKQSCNERWARFRNRLRRRFYARRGQTVDPSTIVNETGTKDMVINKTTFKTNTILPESFAAPMPIEKEDVGIAAGVNEDFEKLVEDYISCVITKAADTLQMERQGLLGNKNVILENSADSASLSPSIISQIANLAVTESLSNVLLESNINQSAIRKDIKEFMMQISLELLAKKLNAGNQSDYYC